MKQLKRIIFILLIAMGAVACGNKTDNKFEKNLSDYSSFISALSSGAIKRADPIVVIFTKDIVDKEWIGKSPESCPFRFEPDIKGKCSWKSSNTLVFEPDKLLNWNTSYKASLDLENLVKLPDKLDKIMKFSFFTSQKQLKLSYEELRLDEAGNYYLEVLINTSDRFDSREIEQSLIVEYPNEQFLLEWDHRPETFSHSLSIRNIVRTKESSELLLNIKSIDNSFKPSVNQYSFTIPGTDVFMLSSVRVKENPDQVLEIVFSDLLSQQQDLRGLVSLSEQKDIKYTIDNNVLKIYPSQSLSGEFTLNVSRSVENKQGKTLPKNYSQKINFGRIKPAIRLLGKGVIMPQSQGLILPFSAVGLEAVDLRVTQIFPNNIVAFFQNNDIDEAYKWQLNRVGRTIITKKISLLDKGAEDLTAWNAFSLDLAAFIEVEPGSIYNVELGFRKAYSLYEEQAEEEADHYVPIEEELLYPQQSYENTYYNYYYDWRNYNNPSSQAYFSADRFVNRNVFCSDLALIAKMDAKGQLSVFVSNLMTTAPEVGVQLSVFDYQNQLLTQAQTDAQGSYRFTPERAPFVLFAQKGNQYAYLKLDNSSAIPVANFETDGVKVEKGIEAFFYAEREVWRPGDSIYLHFILEDREQQLPEGHPISMEIYNPRGQFVKKILSRRDDRCIYPFYFASNKDDPTGNWKVVLKAGTHIFQRGIQVESIKPNRLKVELEISEDLLSKSATSYAKLKARWLHGTPAAHMKAQVSAVLQPHTPKFEQYKDFDFSTPYPSNPSKEFMLFEGQLDNKGEASVNMSFGPGTDFEGYMLARISTKVYEGGGFSINQRSIPFAASEHFVGLKINYSYPSWKKLDNDKNHRIEVVSVDKEGNPVDLSNVMIKLYDLDYHWWYQGNKNLLASYAGKTYHKPVYSTRLSTREGKGSFELKNNSQRYGSYLLLVTAPDGHTCGQQLYFGLPWGSGIQKGDAQVLAMIAERSEYKVGETASLSFPAGKEARALVTLENGKGILHQEWLDNLEAMNEYSFVTSPQMTPNVYVSVMLIQAYAQTANDLPIRLFGLTSFSVEDEQTRLHPVLEIPDELRPEKEYTIRVSESNKQAMDYTIALVDEGLLDLTNFSTPDPWAHFYAKEALGTKTYDMYNEVLGSFGSRLESMYAIGGSDQEIDYSRKKADRFVPIVEVLGPFRLQPGKKAEHKIRLKPYAGSVRAMLIAAGEGRYGSMEKSIRVSEPLMLYASLPRTLALGEKAALPLTVFAMDESIKSVRISIETEGCLRGAADTLIHFDAPGQQDVFFELRAANTAGLGIIKLSAVSGREKTQQQIELDVRQNNPPNREQIFKILPVNESWQHQLSALGLPGTNTARIEISSVLPLNLEYLLSFLDQYPHQCAEQVVSAAFPLLYAPKLLDLSSEKRQEYEQKIKDCIDRLPRYQSMDRGFAFWPGQSS
ncbi:MAG: MG2 domain-containing protein, partial [Bacteroidales bacterium]|nr:MG2 domain-containing protein [Bacteroidales bacterium]